MPYPYGRRKVEHSSGNSFSFFITDAAVPDYEALRLSQPGQLCRLS